MKKVVALVLSVLLLVCAAIPAMAAAYSIDEAKKSVVRIVTEYTIIDDNAADKGEKGYAIGSGFAIGKLEDATVDYFATSAHVLKRNSESGDVTVPTTLAKKKDGTTGYVLIQVDRIYVLLDDINHYAVAQFVQCLPDADVALIRLNTPVNSRRPAVLSNRTEFKTNEELTAMGFPAASEDNLTADAAGELISDIAHVSLNKGTFTVLDVAANTHAGDQITTNATMSPGVSGGPLVDNDGYVVGICVAGSTANPNANYAVTTNELLKVIRSTTDAKYELGPINPGPSTTMIVIIAAGAVAIIALLILILTSAKGKNSQRTLELGGVMAGKTVQLKKGKPVVVGRDPNSCQVIYPADTAGVSRVHCTITFDGKQVLVADNGSSNGTFVGGNKVEPGKPVVMHRGQEITFGSGKNTAALH